MPGLGLAPAGFFALGFGQDEEILGPPEDPIVGATFINPRTRDYVAQDDGSYQRMPVMRHRVLMLLMTELGSAVNVDNQEAIGLRLPQKITPSFQQEVDQAVRAALLPIGNEIRIDAVTTIVLPTGKVDITVSYTDLTTGNSDTVTV